MQTRQIKLLDDVTINKIAAGEVIDRPASALKELLENSADSGATRIEVSFEEGGRTALKVVDNGSGIPGEELPLALQRHATSKIKKIDDVFDLSSFGFRGEALASMGAVSELTLASTVKGQKKGAVIQALGGEIGETAPLAPLEGTQVEIRNLFYNVPARQKFLKSVSGETAAIKKVFKNFAAIHPEIQLSLKQDGKQILFYPSQEFLKRAADVLGVSVQDCFMVNAQEDGFKLKAVLVHPKNNVATQAGIYIYVQNRIVQDKLIQQAVFEGYRNLMMENQYPQAVVSLSVPPAFVDVNVHPAKLQVKFQTPATVFKFVSSQIKKVFAERLEQALSPQPALLDKVREYQPELIRDAVVQYNQKDFQTYEPQPPPVQSIADIPNTSIPVSQISGIKIPTWSALSVIGQLANTYILTQSKNGLVLVDQHAAHERVLFERLKNRTQVEKQLSLMAELIELSAEQIEAITQDQWVSEFKKYGLEYHQRGPNTLAIVSRPVFLINTPIKPLMERVAEQILDAGSLSSLDDIITDIWASMSCHGAIRAGKVLSTREMQELLSQMEEYSFSSFCPHGRPVSVQISLYDLEKLFKRIV